MKELLLSSTGAGLKLRIKAFFPLVIPLLNFFGDQYGFQVMPEVIESYVDALCLIAAGLLEFYGWIRAKRAK